MKSGDPIAILGSNSKYGKFLTNFFVMRGCAVYGADIGTELSYEQAVSSAKVVIFSIRPRYVTSVIKRVIPIVRRDQLLMDVTSVKARPVKTMLRSRAEVAGLHPMCVPPKNIDLPFHGQTIVVCAARIKKWKGWLHGFCRATGARIKDMTPEHHDLYRSFDQALGHSVSLSLVDFMRQKRVNIDEVLATASPFYRIMLSLPGRILKQDPRLYFDIQKCNPHALKTLRQYIKALSNYAEMLEKGREDEYLQFFLKNGEYYGKHNLDEAFSLFESFVESMIRKRLSP